MSDDICGAECTDGTPCEHPAGSCPVPSHADPDADNPQGRDFSITPDDHDAILDAAREGLSESGCARAAGVDWPQLNRYLEAHDQFRSAFRRAREAGELQLVRDGLRDPDTDSSMAKFLLSTSFDYVKTERRELDHQNISFSTKFVEVDDERDG